MVLRMKNYRGLLENTIFRWLAGSILESKGMAASFQKKAKICWKGQNVWKFVQKCTKFENILKKSRWLHAIIARNKLLE